MLIFYQAITKQQTIALLKQMPLQKLSKSKVIDWLWETQDKTFFNSKEDPELCVLKVIPRSIKLMNDDELDTPATIEL